MEFVSFGVSAERPVINRFYPRFICVHVWAKANKSQEFCENSNEEERHLRFSIAKIEWEHQHNFSRKGIKREKGENADTADTERKLQVI